MGFGKLNSGQKIIKNFFSLAAGGILSKLIGFVTIAYLARVLNAKGFGQISFAQAVVSYFILIANLGLKSFGVREIARNKSKIKEYVKNIVTLRLVLTIISFCLLFLFANLIHKSYNIKLLIILYGLSLFPQVFFLDWFFQGIERMEFIGIAQISRSIIYAILIFFFVDNQNAILNVPIYYIIASFIMIIPLFFFSIKKYGFFSFSFNLTLWQAFLKQSLPMGLSAILITIYYNLDTIMLGFFKSDEVVGWYNAAYRIVLVLLTLQTFLTQTIYPIISRYYHHNNFKGMERMMNIYVKVILSISIPIAVGGTVLANSIMTFLFGDQYTEGVVAFQILIWNLIFILGLGMLMNATDNQRKLLIGTAIGAIINTILNFILIPTFSLIGAAVATVVTEIVTLAYFVHEARRIITLPIVQYVYKPFIAAVIMSLILLLWNISVPWAILIGASIYSIIFLAIKGLSQEDIQLIRFHLLTSVGE